MNPLVCLAKSPGMVNPCWYGAGRKGGGWGCQQRWPRAWQTQAGPVPGVWIWGDWDPVQRQNFWAAVNCLMNFSLIREDHARVIPSSGKGSKGKGKHGWLCLFLVPGLLLNGWFRRAGGRKMLPPEVWIRQWYPWGILNEGFFQNIAHKQEQSTSPTSVWWCAMYGSSIHLSKQLE